MKTEKYNVTGMTCAACQANVTRCVQKLDGVEDVNVSLLANQMTVSYDEHKLRPENIISAVEGAGYGASSMEKALEKDTGFRGEWQLRKKQAEDSQQSMKIRLIYSVVLLVPLMYIAMGSMLGLPVPGFFTGTQNVLVSALAQLLLTVPIIFINRHFYQFGFEALFRRAQYGFLGCHRLRGGSGIWAFCNVPHGLRLWPWGHGACA